MKRYRLFESWHNGCDNAENELFAECDREDNMREILDTLHEKFNRDGLGDGFPSLSEGYELVCEMHDNIACYWLARNGEGLMSSEYRRIFRVEVAIPDRPKWDFTDEEELPDTAGYNSMGLLTNGRFSFPFHILADEEGQRERCHVYDSLLMRPEDEICAYDWTDENDEKVINALNRDGDDRSKAAATLTGLW